MKFYKFFLLVLCLIKLSSNAQLVGDDERNLYLYKIESFLKEIDSMNAQFIETNSKNQIATGIFLLKKPNKIKIQYTSPHQNTIVTSGKEIFYWDSELQEQSRYDRRSLPILNILSKRIDLSKDTKINWIKKDEKRIWVNLVMSNYISSTCLTLVFNKSPFFLSEWIINNNNELTKVQLQNVKLNVKIDSNEFKSR